MRAHRQTWIKEFGDIPEGMLVLHRCDNPSCVNIEHLFLGTHKDNMVDMVSKGRNKYVPRSGEKSTASKLTESDVRRIRKMIAEGESDQKISNKFPVTRPAIYSIRVGKSWKHLK